MERGASVGEGHSKAMRCALTTHAMHAHVCHTTCTHARTTRPRTGAATHARARAHTRTSLLARSSQRGVHRLPTSCDSPPAIQSAVEPSSEPNQCGATSTASIDE
eukprot:2908210-Prymnesium_polylepis.1